MSDMFHRFGNALQYVAIAFMTASVLFIGLVLWDLEKRMPNEIPPIWFESQVKDLRVDVRAIQVNLENLKANEVGELKAKVLLLEKELNTLRGS